MSLQPNNQERTRTAVDNNNNAQDISLPDIDDTTQKACEDSAHWLEMCGKMKNMPTNNGPGFFGKAPVSPQVHAENYQVLSNLDQRFNTIRNNLDVDIKIEDESTSTLGTR